MKNILFILLLFLCSTVFAQNTYVLKGDNQSAFRVANNSNFIVKTEFTIEAWVFADETITIDGVGDALCQINSVFVIKFFDDGANNFHAEFFNSKSGPTLSTSSISKGTWNHIAFVQEVGEQLKVYINGALDVSGNFPVPDPTAPTPPDFAIGGAWGTNDGGADGYGHLYNLVYDEFRLSDNARYTSDFDPYLTTTSPHADDNNTIFLFHFDDLSYPPSNSASIRATSIGYTFNIINGRFEDTADDGDIESTHYVAHASIGGGLPLPVELTSFTAQANNNSVILNWETATEVNNYGFDVERKTENSSWSKLGFINGHGNSNSKKIYTYNDNELTFGKHFYRLKQIDIDGSFEYSNIIEINIGAPSNFELTQNFPNPFNPNTTIKFSIPENQFVSLNVYNILGAKITELVNEDKLAGTYKVNFDAKHLNSGMYFFKLETKDFKQIKKMTLLK